MFEKKISKHLTEAIIPFWENLKDEEWGGYYGYQGYDLTLDKTAVKGCILNSRITWFFSEAARILGDDSLLPYAKHGYEFMKKYSFDPVYGGVYWFLDYQGNPVDTIKHTYNQAFAIYALSTYCDASGDFEALMLAGELFTLIETKMRDADGYLEAFTREFQPESNEKLSENGVIADRTMNTALHVLEAYTEYLRVLKKYKNDLTANGIAPTQIEAVEKKLREILLIFADKIWNPQLGRLEVFFDLEYRSLLDLWSYGHDIEGAWLLNRAADVLGHEDVFDRIYPITQEIAVQIMKGPFTGDCLPAEGENGVVKQNRIWWVQAETINGFLDAYLRNRTKTEYYTAAEAVWKYIETYMIDPREGSEWFWEVREDGTPYENQPIVEPWKCPYHNGRTCLNMISWMHEDK